MSNYPTRRFVDGVQVSGGGRADALDDLERAQLARADGVNIDAPKASGLAGVSTAPKAAPSPRMGPSLQPHSIGLPLAEKPAPEPEPAPKVRKTRTKRTPAPLAGVDYEAAKYVPARAAAAPVASAPPVTLGFPPEPPAPKSEPEAPPAARDPDAIADTDDLRAFLVCQMKAAAAGKLSPMRVEHVCMLADRIMAVTRLELDAERVLHDVHRDTLRTVDLVGTA